jgi:hypothetical protein
MAQCQNHQKMTAAVARWIDEASKLPRAAALLNQRADLVEEWRGQLLKAACADRDPPAHLIGLTAIDLIEAEGQLRSAAANMCRVAA